MAFIEIGFTTKRPLILGRGGFGTQLNDWLMDEGWGSADFLDDNAPDAVGGLRDYVDPAILKRGRPAFVALGDNKLRVELLQKLAAAGYSTPVFISDAASVSPSAVLEPGCIILPQAFRGSVAPLGNTLIALLKNSTVAAAASVATETSTMMSEMIEYHADQIVPIFLIFAFGYVVLIIPIGMLTTYLSNKLAVRR